MRLIIAGGRDFNDYELARAELMKTIIDVPLAEIEIVCGGAKGADTIGETFAKNFQLQIKYFIPVWRNEDGIYDRTAGFKRNRNMGAYATHVIVFWDGKSKGTEHMIKEAKKRKLPLTIIMYGESDGNTSTADLSRL